MVDGEDRRRVLGTSLLTSSQPTTSKLGASWLADLLDLLEPVAVMTSVRDSEGRIVDFRYQMVNEAFARTLGEPVDVLVGARLLDLYPSHVELGLFDAFCRVVETGEPFVSELPWFDERNLSAFLEVEIRAFQDGYVVTGRDITEAKMAEQVTRIFDFSQDGIISTDVAGVITAWNAGAESLYGYSESEALGCHISICAPDTTDPGWNGLIGRVIAGEVPVPFEVEQRHRGGTLLNVEVAATPIIGAGGTPIGASLVQRDLSERPVSVPTLPGAPDPDPAASTEHAVAVVGPASTAAVTTEVEVWCRFSHRWLAGFVVIGVNPDGTVLVRRPNGSVLSEALAPDMIRPATGWTG